MSESIVKRTFFGADAIPGMSRIEYATSSPGRLLADFIDIGGGNTELSDRELHEFCRIMPERMTGIDYTSKGRIAFKSYSRADFLGTGTNGSTIAGSGIVPILVGDTIMSGAMAYVAARDVVKVIRMKTETETLPFFTKRQYASSKAPATDMVDIAQDMGKALMQVKTYGLTAGLDKGLIADASGDVISSVLSEMGGTMEQTIDRVVLKALLTDVSESQASATAVDALSTLGLARGTVGSNGFVPTGALVNPMFMAHAMNKMYVPAYNETAQNRALGGSPNITDWLGLKIGQSGVNPGASATWGWGTAAYVGGIVIDANHIGALGLREDMVFEEFDNVTKYLMNPTLTSRFCWATAKDADKSGRTNVKAACLLTETA